jgi:hypothetical protein
MWAEVSKSNVIYTNKVQYQISVCGWFVIISNFAIFWANGLKLINDKWILLQFTFIQFLTRDVSCIYLNIGCGNKLISNAFNSKVFRNNDWL